MTETQVEIIKNEQLTLVESKNKDENNELKVGDVDLNKNQQTITNYNNNNTNDDTYEDMHPKLKKILKTYRSTAQKSISGPSDVTLSVEQSPSKLELKQTCSNQKLKEIDYDNWLVPPNHVRLFSTLKNDANEVSEKCETLLHGERITCFLVGGEKRLCLAEILNYVLKDFTVPEINSVCEKLNIYCSRCTIDQLEVLKQCRILPPTASSCGLITLTDAQRLCHILLNDNIGKQMPILVNNSTSNQTQLRIYHKCFGGSRTLGILHTNMYKTPNSQCIQCEQCHFVYSPQNFVTHSHRTDENKVCHWGFDSSNWRLFVKLVKNLKDDESCVKEFENFKAKFKENEPANVSSSPMKRKSLNEIHIDDSPNKIENSSSTNNSNSIDSSSTSPTSDIISSTIINGEEPCAKKPHKQTSSVNSEQSYSPNASISSVSSNISSLVSSSEHKLLNGLLTKPSVTNGNLNSNFINKSNREQQTIDLMKFYGKALVDNSFNKQYNDEITTKFSSNNIIEGIFDSIKKDIDSNVDSNEIRDRLTSYLNLIQNAYNETCIQFIRNKIETQELKQNLLLENENLRTRIKYLEIETQLLNSQLGVKPGTYQPANLPSQLHQQYTLHHHHHQQQQQQQQLQNVQQFLRLYPFYNPQLHSQIAQTNPTSLSSLASDRNLNINTSKLSSTNGSSIAHSLSPNVTPQQQAAAIALISLNNNSNTLTTQQSSISSPTSTTPKNKLKNNQHSNGNSLNNSHKISSLLANKYSNVNQLLLSTTNMVKCESTQS